MTRLWSPWKGVLTAALAVLLGLVAVGVETADAHTDTRGTVHYSDLSVERATSGPVLEVAAGDAA